METCPDSHSLTDLVFCKSCKASWVAASIVVQLDQLSKLVKKLCLCRVCLAVEDPLINLITVGVLILGWKYSTQDHIFNWQWSHGSLWSDSASDKWLIFGIKASLQTWTVFLLKTGKYLNIDTMKGIFPSHEVKLFSNMKRQRSWLRVECNVEIISQLEVGGGGTDWLENQAFASFKSISLNMTGG